MTEDELVKALREIADDNDDPEYGHGEADRLLLAYIGSKQVIDAYNAIEPKWYA